MRLFLCIVLLFSFLCKTYALESSKEPISVFAGDPSGIIYDAVDVISGSYREIEEDLVLPGPQPLVISRSYSSATGKWHFFPECCLAIGMKEKNSSQSIVALAYEKPGIPISYDYQGYDSAWQRKQSDYKLHYQFQDGICNTFSGNIDSKNNLENSKLKVVQGGVELATSASTKRCYQKMLAENIGCLGSDLSVRVLEEELQDVAWYRLTTEELPCGNTIHYQYNDDRLSEIKVVGKKGRTFASASFVYEKNTVHIVVNKRNMVSYHFQDGLLQEVKREQKPNVTYEYKQIAGSFRLTRKELPEGRFLAVGYNTEAQVSALFTPTLGSEKPLFTFEYKDQSTHVTDAHKNKRVFTHKYFMLSDIEKYQGDALYRKDTMSWEAYGLEEARVADGTGKIFFLRRYVYEGSNLLSQAIASCPITPEAEEILTSRFGLHDRSDMDIPEQFSFDILGNVVCKQLDSKNSVTYEYKQGTKILTKELLWEAGKITRRAFYFYDDETGLLKRRVIDDGKTAEITDLSAVTKRDTLEIQPRKYIQNRPDEESITEKYYDESTKQEKLRCRRRHLFDSEGRLIKRELYDAKDTLCKTEEFAYDDHHNLIRSIDPLGNVILYAYDASDNCISIKDSASQRTTTFQYDASNRLVAKREQYPRDLVTTSFVYDALDNLIVSIDRYGNRTEFAYDAFSRLIRITYPGMLNEKGEFIHPEEHFTYDIFNNVTSEKDPKGYLNRYLYDSAGHILEASYANATTERWHYNKGLLESKLNRDDTISKFYYDDKNLRGHDTYTTKANKQCDERISHNWRFQYSSSSTEDTGGCRIENSYDSQGRITRRESKINKSVEKTEYEYDTLHRPCRIKRWIDETRFIVECKAYDLLDRVIESWIEEPSGLRTNYEHLTYDGSGNVTTITTDLGTETIEYVEEDRPHIITDASGNMTRIEYDECLNALGQYVLCKTVIDPRGVSTCTTYDAFERQVLIMKKDPFGILLAKQELIYDAAGNLAISLETVLPKPEEGQDVIRTEWSYGPEKQLLSLRQAAGTKEMRTTHFTYSKLGLVDSVSYPHAHFSYEYGKDGQLEKIVNAESLKTTTFDYTADRQCSGGTSTEGIITKREVGVHDRVIEEEISDRFGSYVLGYAYDKLGRLVQVKLPDGSSFEYLFEGTRRKATVRKSADGKELYRQECTEYSPAGLVTAQTLIDGKSQKKTDYTSQGGIAYIQTPYYQEVVTSHDSVGDPVTLIRQGKEHVLNYDFLEQLVEKDSFNSVGNRQKGKYNALNQLIEKDQTRYSYDAQANVTEIRSSNSCETLSYNDYNKLISYQNSNEPPVTYQWDVFGRLIQRSEGSEVRRFMYIGDTEIGALDSTGAIIELKIPESITGDQAYGACALEFQGVPFLPITDLFGNIVTLVDPQTSTPIESYEYTAFGQEHILAPDGTEIDPSCCKNPWRYQATRTDPISGFVTFTFRHYDPRMQRFLSEDPLGYLDGSNLYAYAHNNPLVYSDYDGLAAKYGACLCHPNNCAFYSEGVCGHDAGVLLEDTNGRYIRSSTSFDTFETTSNSSFDAVALAPSLLANTSTAAIHGFIDPTDTVWENGKRAFVLGRSVCNWDFSEYDGMSVSDWGRASATRLGEAGGIVGGCYISAERVAIMGIKGTISIGAKVLHSTKATKVVSAAYTAFKTNCAAPAAAAISRNWRVVKNRAQGWFSKVFSRNAKLEQKVTQVLPDGHMWTKNSPFKNKTAEDLDRMFRNKGFKVRGEDPQRGLGSYINRRNDRQYRIDPKNVGRYREPNHVDVQRLDNYAGNLEKKRFGYLDD